MDEHTLVYADPPYFKEHYSRYYHVLNTMCLHDYPELAINPQSKEYEIGRYRADRNVSDFGKKAKARSAFQRLIDSCADNYLFLERNGQMSFIKPSNYNQRKTKKFKKQIGRIENMSYDPEEDCFTCAEGGKLPLHRESTERTEEGQFVSTAWYRCENCSSCSRRDGLRSGGL